MPRFHLPPDQWQAAALTGDEAKHLAQVLRLRAGDTITVFDGHGRRASAVIGAVAKDRVSLEIGEDIRPPALRPRVILAQAVPKGKNMDFIVQKSVELGVAAIQPLITKHTIVQPGDGKADKWRRTALEACKQCGQDTLPDVAEAAAFAPWIAAERSSTGVKIIASLAPSARPFREVLEEHPAAEEITLLVGPEGDFTAEETGNAVAAGYQPVTLGGIVLRVETASLFCLSAVRFFYP